MTSRVRVMGLVVALLCCTTVHATAEDERGSSGESLQPRGPTRTTPLDRSITESDKRALIEAFEGVDPEKYRLQFDNGQTYGRARVEPQDLEQVRRSSTPGVGQGAVVVSVTNGEVTVSVTTLGNQLESLIGARKAAQLRAILAKYRAAGTPPQRALRPPEGEQPSLRTQPLEPDPRQRLQKQPLDAGSEPAPIRSELAPPR